MNDVTFARHTKRLRGMLDHRARALGLNGKSRTLYDACSHVLQGRGKRLRGILLILSCESVGGAARRALDAGVAIETMHDFTLVHDDIMDNAEMRRGRPTIHERWDRNTAILAGDLLLGLAYRSLGRTKSPCVPRLMNLLTEGMIDVCDGQGMDMELAHRADVTLAEYFSMIEKKTGSLIATATEMGGLIGEGNPSEVRALRKFGQYLGRAFQIQDDLLDVVADAQQLGKPVGGDIVEGKKTFLLISAARQATGGDKKLLNMVMRGKASRASIAAVTELFHRYGIIDEASRTILQDTKRASQAIEVLRPSDASSALRWLAGALVHRAS